MGNQGELPLFANHIVKIQLSQEADTIANLGKEYRTLSPSFGIDELDELAASLGEHQLIRAHIRMEDRAYEEEVGFDRWVILEYKERIDVMEAVKTFKDRKRWVDDACPEYIRYPAVVPNDPWNTSNWGHNNTGNNGPGSYGSGTPGFDSSAHLAWDQAQGYGTSDIIIAIIDSGVDINHPDLRLMAGYDYGDNDSDPMDDSGGGQNSPRGHGTACAGIAAGIANNGIGVSGIAGGCTVMPLKAADSDGYLYDSYIINAITHARNNGAHIISLSLGGEGQMGSAPAFDNALTYAYNAGITIFAAIGNGNASSILYPANHNKVIAVGAASPSGQRKSPSSSDGQYWWGSNYGVNTQDNTKAVDIMAATILPTTDITGSGGYASGSYYNSFNGTSCATPYAAGVAALVKSRDPSLTPAEIRSILTSTATDMTYDGGVGWDRYTGYGMVNAYQAVLAAGGPECEITSPQNGDQFYQGETVTINVTASDSGGSISNVKFYIDNQLKYTDNSSPYSWNWNTSTYSLGNHTIKVVATNNQGKTAEESIVVTLINYPAPLNLVGSGGNELVRLDWDAPTGATPTGYKIYKDGSFLTTTPDTFYTDTDVINDTTYSYHVTALYGTTESAASNTVYVTPEWMNTTIIGTGNDITAANEGCPINVFLKSLHGQSVYLASELIAAGVQGPLDITEIGFYVTDVPINNMENYIIRMRHTSATDVSAWINSDDLQTVYTSASYMPSGTGWNMFTFSTPFTWNGVDNIVVDTAFGVNAATSQSGRVQYTTVTDGYRYVRHASSNQTNVFSGGYGSDKRPNLRLTLAPTPLELGTPLLNISRDGGNIRLSWDAVEHANRYLIYATTDPTQWQEEPSFETEQYFLELPLQSERMFYRIKASYIEP